MTGTEAAGRLSQEVMGLHVVEKVFPTGAALQDMAKGSRWSGVGFYQWATEGR